MTKTEKQQTTVNKEDLNLLDYFIKNIKDNKLKTTMYTAFVSGLKRKVKEEKNAETKL